MIKYLPSARTAVLSLIGTILSFATIANADCRADLSGSLCNPTIFGSVSSFIAGALKVMVEIALPIIAVYVVISGFKFISARGNTEKLGAARKNFYYVIIGALLILGAWVIANLIAGTVQQVLG
jgi:hypothetical protein